MQVGTPKLEQVYILDTQTSQPKVFKNSVSTGSNLFSLVSELVIEESIDFPAIRGTVTINDSADFYRNLMGNEVWVFKFKTGKGVIHTYQLQTYAISSRIRSEKTELYVVQLIDPTFLKNETINVFGAFSDKKCSDYVDEILTSSKYLGLKKSMIKVETTKDPKNFVIPNWRPYDAINFIADKSIRSVEKGSMYQSGFIFYQSISGYHFTSIDKMISDINKSSENPSYSYSPKNISVKAKDKDEYSIISVTFPDMFNSLQNVRNGTWSGFVAGINPVFMNKSNLTTVNKQINVANQRYNIIDMFPKMEHLDNGSIPININDPATKQLLTKSKRTRFKVLPQNVFSGENNPNYGNALQSDVSRAAYTYLRKNSMEAIKLSIVVPGNTSLYAGSGIRINIPSMVAKGSGRIEPDLMYSGLYLIASVRHRYSVNTSTTELYLLKDSIKK
jgi:hypothetical protein